ncbi:ferrous iron transport protein B [Clostridium tagluense]|uniref:ferrous iron transport protein B n=1 Tax=Clostridium tagluense TaxID=360422 RepID=UPI001CF16D36|nr:ferrous iron transport protein B [Clostridium tagluense]MCB2312732.1 ferrous iron transport protein B [Clostridium tagluense]MCB2317499.1 ferrous iron transport protein B [Clostridium tagluense]MCB2322269.1 ferrous iron transport protein B [Clostridium tagluense]MCB2327274.1 ferrous iron transport protein B [Clostridium tagluense]MCB2332000.1 ferrous iron transport protein B [Clostridium tagluense]
MGLTNKSTGTGVLEKDLRIDKATPNDKIIALGGNPNVGKSTVFNNLTGLKQHTGNWPGKTVANAQGKYSYKNNNFILVDIPGTYSLMVNSVEEEIARDFICFGNPDATVIVVDATCLERNLNLVIQTLEITSKVVVCVNLIDEAKRKGITINLEDLSRQLGVPAVGTSAIKAKSLNELMDVVFEVAFNKITPNTINIIYEELIEKAISKVENALKSQLQNKLNTRWVALKLIDGDETLLASINKYLDFNLTNQAELMNCVYETRASLNAQGINSDTFRDKVVSQIVETAEKISSTVVSVKDKNYNDTDRKIDKYLTSKKFGIPIMILLLAVVFWLTITGANIPSKLIADGLFWVEDKLTIFFIWLGTPAWVHGLLVLGMYRTLAWVISVMLPPMAIFFPLFTLLEDLGYLPRVAFNLDNYFKKACACGKQALTMCMGFGCNAAGIIGCRIIDSPRERLIAIITNNFVPCNGRFPTLIAIITMFFGGIIVGPVQSIISTLILTGVIILGVVLTLIISKILSKTILKGIPSNFTLELPPYRKPLVGKVIVRSIFDRTLFVLGRAMIVAAPAGIVIWAMANIHIGDLSILTHCANFFDPFARLIGLDGYILMAFILGFPANEIVVPIIIMCYMSTGSMVELDSLVKLKTLLVSNGWTSLTAVCVMLFSLMHWPCATTCLTIKKETQSIKWTLVSFLVPTITGIVICFIVASTVRLMGFL